MATNFRQAVNDFFHLPSNATATDRKDALRAATLEQIATFCRLQPNAQNAYATICGLIAPEPWDIRVDLESLNCQAVWGETPICNIPLSLTKEIDHAIKDARARAAETLSIWFNTCYPACVSDLPPYEFKSERGLVAGYFEGRFVLDGLDHFSVLGGLKDWGALLVEQGLTGEASAYEGTTLFEVSHG